MEGKNGLYVIKGDVSQLRGPVPSRREGLFQHSQKREDDDFDRRRVHLLPVDHGNKVRRVYDSHSVP